MPIIADMQEARWKWHPNLRSNAMQAVKGAVDVQAKRTLAKQDEQQKAPRGRGPASQARG
ncbi:hypothetical protein U9M48_017909 [Paspalum notatum var. saurae]|uniref:Uncharacterized protein n=1 Tax=Paspalum notatum var. saurae TaxID=547442 RepID=A0AAQ3T8D8_PASNO